MQNNNNEFQNNYQDINECTSRGACSISPTISALQEVAILLLQHLAHYILELEKLGGNNQNIKYEILNFLGSLISINEFSDNQLYQIIMREYYLLEDAKNAYQKICKEKQIVPAEIKSSSSISNINSIAQAISMGEKISLNKYKKFNSEQKNLTEILLIVIKSLNLNLIKLCDFERFDSEIYHEILDALDMYNHSKISAQKIYNEINRLARLDNKLQIEIAKLFLEIFGGISEVSVSHSTRQGKAILVSGNNFFDLLNVLESTKDKDIDIYTHSNLLITHAMKRFNEFKNLKGHFGNLTENCILDFATFPGAILLTKNSKNTPEYLYRGRLFSNDYIVPNGVIKIENNDYTELIDSAQNAKGFSKGKTKDDTILGYNEGEIEEKFNYIIENLNNDKIKKLYIIGIDSHLECQREYFNELFSNLKENEYAISFSYSKDQNNILTIPIGNYIPLATNLLKSFFDKYPISSEKLVFFITTCDVMSISNTITLNEMDARNIYMAKCPPTLINPSVLETLAKKYKIKFTTNAKNDLKNIRQNS